MNREEAAARRAARRDALFDHLASTPEGLDIEEIMVRLDCSYHHARDAVHDLRMFLGEFDDINVPCTPRGERERWVYELEASKDATREWTANRIDDGDTRLRTIRAMMASAVAATDGRKAEGKRARRIERGLRHLIEDLDAIIAETS